MARKQLKKHRLFGSRNPSGRASNSVCEQSEGPSQAPVQDVALNSATPGNISQGVFARARHFFHRSTQGSVAGAASGGQEQREEVQAALIQDTQRPADNTETGTAPAAPDSNINATVGPVGDTNNGAADPHGGASATLTPVPALVGSELDAARQGLERMTVMPRVDQTVIQNLSDTYLQPIMTFSSTVATIAQVHPYATLALGILNTAAQSLINQTKIDGDMLDIFDTVRAVYEFLLEDDTIQNINSMKETLGKIAQVINDAARFIKNYSDTTSFCTLVASGIE
ncbi:hypothetical protein EV401DRAFT_676782 [Pisolithus croceorrhizus]|nr:hypothetical protein EV401DRAFT_676782 [Pisolithus croceorrhizus]